MKEQIETVISEKAKISQQAAENQNEQRIEELMAQNIELKKEVKALLVQTNSQPHSQEIQCLKEKLKSTRQNLRKAKSLAADAVNATTRLQRRVEGQKHKNSELQDRISLLEHELEDIKSDRNLIEERHHAALRLIGELWTRNQSLIQKSPVTKSLNTTH